MVAEMPETTPAQRAEALRVAEEAVERTRGAPGPAGVLAVIRLAQADAAGAVEAIEAALRLQAPRRSEAFATRQKARQEEYGKRFHRDGPPRRAPSAHPSPRSSSIPFRRASARAIRRTSSGARKCSW